MASTTRPFFVVSSGRSGAQMIHGLLAGRPGVEVHHEYLCTHVLRSVHCYRTRSVFVEMRKGTRAFIEKRTPKFR